MKFAWTRFWAKKEHEKVTRVDNMKKVSLFTQFQYEVMAAMSEFHAASILEERYGRPFTPPPPQGGGRADFGLIEVKADPRDEPFVNINKNASRNSLVIVKFQTNLATGVSLEVGWNSTVDFYEQAQFNERPYGRSYYQGPVPRTTREWVEYYAKKEVS